ncbi:MAG TPA: class I SAM-dependent methyltransferase [Anaeromyxobacteraceae bacterium]|nr:class I SAM-dependent methyltransferase [Anaeromyxobacteraceae bacterium]
MQGKTGHDHGASHSHRSPHPGGRGGPHDRHGNPHDLARYLSRLEGEDRAEWQEPERVLAALRLRRGATVCDVGAGPGYFALRMARQVGPGGVVYAIDVEPRMIETLRERMREAGVGNVRPLLATASRPGLPPRPCDLILVVNTFHHFPAGVRYLARLAARLGPGGRIVNIDFHKREMPVGPPVAHKVDRVDFLAAAAEAGLRLAREHRFLRHQYFLELEPGPAVAGREAGRGRAPRPAPRRGGAARERKRARARAGSSRSTRRSRGSGSGGRPGPRRR